MSIKTVEIRKPHPELFAGVLPTTSLTPRQHSERRAIEEKFQGSVSVTEYAIFLQRFRAAARNRPVPNEIGEIWAETEMNNVGVIPVDSFVEVNEKTYRIIFPAQQYPPEETVSSIPQEEAAV